MQILKITLVVMLWAPVPAAAAPAAPEPTLTYAFSARVTVAPPIEQGTIDGKRTRFIAITGGSVEGPRLSGTVIAGGGDWQAIADGGLTEVMARYFIRADDGTVIAVENPGVRTASSDVIDRLSKGEDVDPALYYFRTTPKFTVPSGNHEWMRRKAFVARGVRKPDQVMIDFYVVD